ncbi:MAG TPA: hypothetical protein VFL78_05785 [Rhodanobacteraceae bacterium]|nr:hypothetical protein [Rhodanobacteraceae bacterium]
MAEVKLLSVFQPDSLGVAIMNKTKILFFAGLAVAAMLAGQARATTLNESPPPGWIINLDGQPVPTNPVHYVQYTTYFFAMQTTTYITFAMRNDTFDSTFLDTIAVTDVGNPGVNLIQNGDFEDGTAPSGGYANAPVDWYYRNPYGALETAPWHAAAMDRVDPVVRGVVVPSEHMTSSRSPLPQPLVINISSAFGQWGPTRVIGIRSVAQLRVQKVPLTISSLMRERYQFPSLRHSACSASVCC